jgi:hypothetical protein
MRAVAEALADMDEESAARVLRWAVERFGRSPTGAATRPSVGTSTMNSFRGMVDARSYEDLASFFAAAQRTSGPEKALVVGYWHQVIGKKDELDAQTINRDLKNLGHQLANVTVTLGRLMSQRPALVVQIRKGQGKAARKGYRLSNEGIKKVEQWLASGGEASDTNRV